MRKYYKKMEERLEAAATEGLSMDSLNEIVSTSRIWKEEIEQKVLYKRFKPGDQPKALLAWLTKVLQLVRRCLS